MSTHAVANGNIFFFLWPSSIPPCKYTTSLFNHTSADGHLGCFHILEFLSNAAMNIEGECIFSNYYFCFFWIFTQDWNNCWVIWYLRGFPGGTSGKDPACQCKRFKRCRFNSWVGETPLKENMATHSSILAWRLPWTEEPGGLEFTGLQSQTRLKWFSTTQYHLGHYNMS